MQFYSYSRTSTIPSEVIAVHRGGLYFYSTPASLFYGL
jgi:hypothetical protein